MQAFHFPKKPEHNMPAFQQLSFAETRIACKVLSTALDGMAQGGKHLHSPTMYLAYRDLSTTLSRYESELLVQRPGGPAQLLPLCREMHALYCLDGCTRHPHEIETPLAIREELQQLLLEPLQRLNTELSLNGPASATSAILANRLDSLVGQLYSFKQRFLRYILYEYLKNGTTESELNESMIAEYEREWNNAMNLVSPYYSEEARNDRYRARPRPPNNWPNRVGGGMVFDDIQIGSVSSTGSVGSNNTVGSMSVRAFRVHNDVAGNVLRYNRVGTENWERWDERML